MSFDDSAAWVVEAAARGYLSAEEVIAWADTAIEASAAPPFWLLEVSCSKKGVVELANLFRPHVPEIGFVEKARIAANAFVRDRSTAPEVFDAMTRLWVESMSDDEASSELPDSIEALLAEHDQLLAGEPLPSDFHERFESAVRELTEAGDSFPFPPV